MYKILVLASNFASSGLLWWFLIQSLSVPKSNTLIILWATPICALVVVDNIFFLCTMCMSLMQMQQKQLQVCEQPIQQIQPIQPTPHCIAMITTKTPSEPLVPTLVRTLTAMVQQQYLQPVDIWLADESPDHETLAWCAENGVRVCSRKDNVAYNQSVWPRRTRCKEGNLAYFYDTYGYNSYDFVFQFDSDHAPDPEYLSTTMPYFLNSDKVSYIACPSISDMCIETSWIGRARLVSEAHDYGVYAKCFPMMTGSHYAVRVSALKEIGGIGPELDEDMSTTLMFMSRGHKGVYAINAIAHGYGPACFAHAMRQEFQWAKSATTLFTTRAHIRTMFGGTHVIQAFPRVLVFVWWYTSNVSWIAWTVCAPIVACFVQTASAPKTTSLLLCMGPGFLSSLGYLEYVRRTGGMRPIDIPRSWGIDVVVLRQCRAFWITLGVLARGMPSNIRVTPKDGTTLGSFMYLVPMYIVCGLHIACMAAASILWPEHGVSPVIILVCGMYSFGIGYVTVRDCNYRQCIALVVLVTMYMCSWVFSIVYTTKNNTNLWAQMFTQDILFLDNSWIERGILIGAYALALTSLIASSSLTSLSSSPLT